MLEMLKFNEHAYLFGQHWYCIQYNPETYHLQFKPCDTPNLAARDICVLPTCSLLLKEEKQAVQVLLQPVIFGEKLAQRMIEANVITNPALLTQAKGD